MARTATLPAASAAAHPAAAAGFTLTEMIVVVALIAVGFAVAIPVTHGHGHPGQERQLGGGRRTPSSTAPATAPWPNGATSSSTFITAQPHAAGAHRGAVAASRPSSANCSSKAARSSSTSRRRPDTPDAFGAAERDRLHRHRPVMFTSDGSLIDSAGDVANGTVFMGVPDHPETRRGRSPSSASPGMLRTWKWRGAQWFQ